MGGNEILSIHYQVTRHVQLILNGFCQKRFSTLTVHISFVFEINGPDFQCVKVFDVYIVPIFLFLPLDHFDLHFLAFEKNFEKSTKLIYR